MREEHRDKLAHAVDEGIQQKGKLTLIKNEYEKYRAERVTLGQQFEQLSTELTKLNKQIEAHKQNIKSQVSELTERQTTISDKDQRIQALKIKTQELEKFKFVLDYKIKELKKDIKPCSESISSLREQTTKMQQEVKHFTRVKTNLELIVTDLKLKMRGLETENQKMIAHIKVQNTVKKQLRDDIFDVLTHINDYKLLKAGIIEMYKKYVTIRDDENSIANLQKLCESSESGTAKCTKEERNFKESQLNTVTDKLDKSKETFNQQNRKIMGENVELISQINSLKMSLHDYKLRIRDLKLKEQQKAAGHYAEGGIHQSTNEQMEMMRMLQGENEAICAEMDEWKVKNEEILQEIRVMHADAEARIGSQHEEEPREATAPSGQPAGDPEMGSNMEPNPIEGGSLDEAQAN